MAITFSTSVKRLPAALRRGILLAICLTLAVAAALAGGFWLQWANAPRTGEDFNVPVLRSAMDFNKNGLDDYADFVAGAYAFIGQKPSYDGAYCTGGTPPPGVGVCTDVIWSAFAAAGYDLRSMVDRDIKENPQDYPNIFQNNGKPDSAIDFRRVVNLLVFFRKHSQTLPTQPGEPADWQPGDIVIYSGDSWQHIALCSPKRNRHGMPYILHHGGRGDYEANRLFNEGTMIGHYRFDASKIDSEILL